MTRQILTHALVLLVGAGVGTYFNQKHTVEEKIVYKDKVKTVVKEIITERPDGTKVIERHTTKDEKKKQVAQKKESKPIKKDWAASLRVDLRNPTQDELYTAEISRRIMGDIYVGAYGRSDGSVGVGLTILF